MLTAENGGVKFFQYTRVAHALALDIKGIKFGGSVMNLAKSYCGSSKRTKRGVLIDYVAWLESQYPDWTSSDNIKAAMKK